MRTGTRAIRIRCTGSGVLPIEQLEELQGNLKHISPDNLDKLKRLILTEGFIAPIFVWRENGRAMIIDGHQRLKALRSLEEDGYKIPELPVAEVQASSAEDAKRKVLHVVSQFGRVTQTGFDALVEDISAKMGDLLQEINIPDVKIVLEPEAEEEQLPEVPLNPVTKPGDLWRLGRHRLVCGDCASEADLDKLVRGARVDLLNTDPPYNVNVEPARNDPMHPGAKVKGVKQTDPRLPRGQRMRNDFLPREEFDRMLAASFANFNRVLAPGAAFYIWGGYSNLENYFGPLRAAGFHFAQAIVWVKLHPMLIRKDFMGNWEVCFYGWKRGRQHRFFGPKNVPDTWEVQKLNPATMLHLTEKPVELAARALEYSTLGDETVLDGYAGGGSTLVACERLGRRCLAMELHPGYCDVIVERWEREAGRKARRVPA